MRTRARRSRLLAALAAAATCAGALTAPAVAVPITAEVRGSVTDASGDGAPDVSVVVYAPDPDSGWATIDAVRTRADGSYVVDGLPAGDYRLGFRVDDDRNLVDEFFDDAADVDAATTLQLGAGAVRTGVDAELSPGGSISGSVSVPDAELHDLYVTTYSYDTAADEWRDVGGGPVAEDGTWTVDGLRDGTYRIGVNDVAGEASLAQQFYGPSPDVWSATDVVITDHGAVADISMALVDGAQVLGTVTDPTGAAVDAEVEVHRRTAAGDYRLYASGHQGADESGYSVPGLPAGTYRLGFVPTDPRFHPEYWDDAATLAAATDVVVTSGIDVAGRSAVLTGGVLVVTPPAISGVTRVGRTLAVSNGTWDPTGVSVTRQWLRDGVEIPGATGSTYVLTAADRATRLTVRSRAARAGWAPTSVVSAPTAVIGYGVLAAGAAPTVTGTPRVGSPLGATSGTWTPGDGLTYGYSWRRAGTEVGTGSTYTPSAADVGAPLTVRVTASKDGYSELTATSAPTVAVAKGVMLVGRAPMVTGTAQVGQTLTTDGGVVDPAADSRAFQWLADGTAIAGATGPSYVVAATQVGARISVRVTATRAGYDDRASTSLETGAVVKGVLGVGQAPTVSGTLRVGETLTTDGGVVDPAADTRTYQWLADGAAITGATGPSYLLTAAQLGTRVSVRVSAARTGYDDQVTTSMPTAVIDRGVLTVGEAPSVTGVAQVGRTLTASGGVFGPPEVARAYQWLADGTPVAGATSSSFPVTAALVGARISVQVTASRPAFDDATATSAPTAPVTRGVIEVRRAPSVSGVARTGATLSTDGGLFAPDEVTRSYQWLADDVPIAGAREASYVVAAEDVDKRLTVQVSAGRDGYDDRVSSSAPVHVVEGTLEVVAPPTVSGTPRVGEVLSTTGGEFSPADVARTYQWLAEGEPIVGAVAVDHLVTEAEVGKAVSVRVTARRDGYETVETTSAPTGGVTPAPVAVIPPTSDPTPTPAPTPAAIVVANLQVPSITGSAVVGKVLKAGAGSWSTPGLTFTYQWFAKGKPVKRATGARLKITAAMIGAKLTVRVTATAAGASPVTATSKATKRVTPRR